MPKGILLKKYQKKKIELRSVIQHYSEEGWSNYKIAKKLMISIKTAKKWSKRDYVIPKRGNKKLKFPEEVYNRIADLGRDKYTGLDKASSHKIQSCYQCGIKRKGHYFSYDSIKNIKASCWKAKSSMENIRSDRKTQGREVKIR